MISRSLNAALDSVRRSSAAGPAKALLRTLGLQRTAYRLYTSLQARLAARSGTYAVTARGEEATFRIDSPAEYHRLRSMTELTVLLDILNTLRPDDVFYDVGANYGIYTCLVGQFLDAGSVVAFEPHPRNYEELRRNVEANGVSARVFQRALSDEAGEVDLAVGVDSHATIPGHNVIEVTEDTKAYGERSTEHVSVEMAVGDTFVDAEGLPTPNVVKIDVEGAEMNVLRGLEATLAEPECRAVYCEVHADHLPKFGATEADVVTFLEERGFEVVVLDEFERKKHVRATRRGDDA